MGVWGFGVFESDDASDLGFEVDDAESLDEVRNVLAEAIDTVLRDPANADVGDVRVATAAAAIVALSVDPGLTLEDKETYGPETWDPATLNADGPLITSARALVDLVCLPLVEQPWNDQEPLWDSAEDHEASLREVTAVRAALAVAG